MPFSKMAYASGFLEISFFASLGRYSILAVNSDWYGEKGQESAIMRTTFTDEAGWREAYWAGLQVAATTKFNDWSYEEEYRLVRNALMERELDEEDRTLSYDFEDLDGIIFGINTSDEVKERIIDIVMKKCAETGRKDFSFMQAGYSRGRKALDIYDFSLVDLASMSLPMGRAL